MTVGLLSAAVAIGQVSRDLPDYRFEQTRYRWLEVSDRGHEVRGFGGNSFLGPFPIGFQFPFFGRVYERFYIGANGIIGFGPTAEYGSPDHQFMPWSRPPDNFIALFWKDLDPEAGWADGRVYYGVVEHKLVVQFQEVGEWNAHGRAPDNTITMQAVIVPNGDILLQYRHIGERFDLNTGTIGVEGPGGGQGLTIRHDGDGEDLSSERAWRVSRYPVERVLVWDAGSRTQSGLAQSFLLREFGMDVTHLRAGQALPEDLGDYDLVFANLGNYGQDGTSYHQLTEREGEALARFLDNGGGLYLEGGDVWLSDPVVEVHRYFHIRGVRNAGAIEAPLTGAERSPLEGMVFDRYYARDNNWADVIEPQADAQALMWFTSEGRSGLGMVGYRGGNYRTVGCSFEFGGLGDGDQATQADLMGRLLQFFRSPPPEFPAPFDLEARAGDAQVILSWDYDPEPGLQDARILAIEHELARLADPRHGNKPSRDALQRTRRLRQDLRRVMQEMQPRRDEFQVFRVYLDGEPYDETDSRTYTVLELENGRSYEFAVTAVYTEPDGESEPAGPVVVTPALPISPPFSNDLEDNNAGLWASPSRGGWEWGRPQIGAASGQKAWGTSLRAPYPDNAESYLYFPELNLEDGLRARLAFNYLMDCEPDWDGGRAEISRDGGRTWWTIAPVGGYPRQAIFALDDGPGFSGVSGGWRHTEFDLSAYGGSRVQFRLLFRSDESNFQPWLGWFIDDPALYIPRRGDVGVLVTRDDGRTPIADVLVVLDGDTSFTGANGDTARFREIPAGRYRLAAYKRGFIADSSEVEVQPDRLNFFRVILEEWDSRLTLSEHELDEQVEPNRVVRRRISVVNNGAMPTDFQIFLNFFPQRNVVASGYGFPNHGELWQLLQTYDLTAATREEHFYGAVFIAESFPISYKLVSGAGAFDNPYPTLYHFDRSGRLIRQVRQGGAGGNNPIAGWGLYDLEYDGTYIYGAINDSIIRMDPITGQFSFLAGLPSPLALNRAVAYVPEENAFWVGNWDDTWYKLSYDGRILDRVTDHGLTGVAGMAWNPADPDGACLYVHNQESAQGGAAIYRYNTTTRQLEPDPVLVTADRDEGTAGGAFVTYLYDTHTWTLGVVIQRAAGDQVKLYALQPRQGWMRADPGYGRVEAQGEVAVDVELNSAGVIGDVLIGRLELYDIIRGDLDVAVCTLRVGGEWPMVFGEVTADRQVDLTDAVITLGGRTTRPVWQGDGFAYVFNRVSPGRYTVTGALAGFLPFQSQPFVLDVGESEQVDVVFRHVPMGAISGRVESREGGELAGVEIVAFPEEADTFFTAYSNGEGTFQLRLPAGIYEVRAQLSGYRVERRGEVEVGEGDPTEVNFVLDERLPVTGLRAQADFDDRVELTWLPPGTPGQSLELQYDSGVLANGATVTSYDDILAVRFQVEGEYDLASFALYFVHNNELAAWGVLNNGNNRVRLVVLEEDPQTGLPGREIFVATNGAPSRWVTVNTPALRFLEGAFYVGFSMDPSAADREYLGMDDEQDWEGVTYVRIDGSWRAYDRLPGDLMARAVVWVYEDQPGRDLPAAERILRPTRSVAAAREVKEAQLETIGGETVFQVTPDPFDWVQIYASVADRQPHRDEFLNYIVYVDGQVAAENVELNRWTHAVGSASENQVYEYQVGALYQGPDGEDERRSVVVQARPNMPPGPVRNLRVTVDERNYEVAWSPPLTNRDGSRCVDYSGAEVLLNNAVVAEVDANTFSWRSQINEGADGWYEIAVRAHDEVPNRSTSATAYVAIGDALVYNFESAADQVLTVQPIGGWQRSRNLRGPSGAHSGSYAWMTKTTLPPAEPAYEDRARWTLTTAGEYLVKDENAVLEFYHWLSAEDGHDGGQVLVSVEGGPWRLLYPEGGYPNEFVAAFANQPAFTGRTNDWTRVVFPLGEFRDRYIRVQWTFASDASLNRFPGWFVDDMVLWRCSRLSPTSVFGTVTDQNGTPVVGATVVLDEHRTTTVQDGYYQMDGIRPGRYTLVVRKPGLPSWESELEVEAGAQVQRDVSLFRPTVTTEPAGYAFNLNPGDSGTLPLAIANLTDEPLPFKVFLIDRGDALRDPGHAGLRRLLREPGRDEFGEVLWQYNLNEVTGLSGFQGVEFANARFVLTASDPARGNVIVTLDREGGAASITPQPVEPLGRGFRDLAWDGSALYASQDARLWALTPDGRLVGWQWGAPLSVNLALAWDETQGGFWAADETSPWFLVDRSGNVLNRWNDHGLEGVIGLAWHPGDLEMPLLAVCRTVADGERRAAVYQGNPLTGELDEILNLPGSPAGAFVTGEWDLGRWVMGVVVATEEGENLVLVDLGRKVDWATVNPQEGELGGGEELYAELHLSVPARLRPGDVLSAEAVVVAYGGELAVVPVTVEVVEGLDHYELVPETDVAMTVRVESAFVRDRRLVPGSEIAVLTPRDAAAGGSRWISPPVVFQVFGGDEGFQPGEILRFRMWDAREQAEYPADAAVVEGWGRFVQDGLAVVRLDAVIPDSQEIALASGWNLISTYIHPAEISVVAILAAVNARGNLHMVKDETGAFWVPWRNFNALDDWAFEQAYYVNVTRDDTLRLTGRRISPLTPVPVDEGWNYVAYLLAEVTDPRQVLADYVDDIQLMKDDWGYFWVPELDFWSGLYLQPGRGYLLSALNDFQIVYGEARNLAHLGLVPRRESLPPPTGSDMSLVILEVPAEIPTGALALVKCGGRLVGRSVVESSRVGVIVRGDDTTTAALDGARPGEDLNLTIEVLGEERTYPHKILSGTLQFAENQLTVVELQPRPEEIPREFGLISVQPNPFNSRTTVRIALPENGALTVRLRSLDGRTVWASQPKYLAAGVHQLTVDGVVLASGLYILDLQFGGRGAAVKLMVLR